MPSLSSWMLKEGLMFLEAENEITADSVKVLRDIIEKILELCASGHFLLL